MHESGLVQNQIGEIDKLAGNHGPLAGARVVIGALSPVTAEALRLHWEVLFAGTPVEGVALEVFLSDDIESPAVTLVSLVSVTTAGD